MNIGIVSSAYPPVPGGTQVYVQSIARALVDAGHQVTAAIRFISRPASVRDGHTAWDRPDQFHDQGVQVRVVVPPRLRRILLRPVNRLHYYRLTESLAIRLHRAALSDVLHDALRGVEAIHYSGTGRELLGFSAMAVARRLGVPIVVTPHTHFGSWGDSELDMKLYRRCDRLIALTQYEMDQYEHRGLDPQRIDVIPNIVEVAGTGDNQRFRDKHGIPTDSKVVLYLGRRTQYKGYRLTLDAAPRVWQVCPETHFVFAGPDSDDTAHIEADHPATLADRRVHNLGLIDPDEKEDALAACDVFCLPSKAEAFGIVYVEAMHYGKPTVGLDIPTMCEQVLNSGAGLVCKPTADSLSKALLKLLTGNHSLSEAGREFARLFKNADIAAGLTQAYTDCLTKKQASHNPPTREGQLV